MFLCKNILRITSESISSQQRLGRALANDHLRMAAANVFLKRFQKIFLFIYSYSSPPAFTNTMKKIKY